MFPCSVVSSDREDDLPQDSHLTNISGQEKVITFKSGFRDPYYVTIFHQYFYKSTDFKDTDLIRWRALLHNKVHCAFDLFCLAGGSFSLVLKLCLCWLRLLWSK